MDRAIIGSLVPQVRHLIENFFGKFKAFKRVAVRSDKADQSFSAMTHLVASVIHSKMEAGVAATYPSIRATMPASSSVPESLRA